MSMLSKLTVISSTSTPSRPASLYSYRLRGWEMVIMRLAFAFLAFATIKWEVNAFGAANPEELTGLAHWVNFDWLRSLSPLWLWKTLTILGLLIYVAGILPCLGLLPALFFSISIGTLANSQGAINHSTQLVSMILLGQFLVYALPFHRSVPLSAFSWFQPPSLLQQRSVYVSAVIFAAAYVVSGYTKLSNSDWEWIQRVPWLAVELQKTNWSEYYDTLTPVPPSLETVVNLMTNHPNLARLFFGTGLFLELFAFLALIGRRWAFFYGLAIILMHLSISRLMQLDFWTHILAALIFLVNLPGIAKTFSSGGRRR